MLPILFPLDGTDKPQHIVWPPAAFLRMLTAKLRLQHAELLPDSETMSDVKDSLLHGRVTKVFQLRSDPKSDCDCGGLLKD